MACTRNCAGVSLCNALNLCCIQLRNDCGKAPAEVPEGYTVINITNEGDVEICSNPDGTPVCFTVPTGSDSMTDNGDGTFTHTDLDGNPVILDICTLLTDAYAQSAWAALPLGAGWAAEAGMQVPQYRCLCDGTVQLRGCMTHDDADADNAVPTSIGTLPVDDGAGHTCRPTAGVRFQGGANCASIEIATDGTITTNPSILPDYRCLDGMEFFV